MNAACTAFIACSPLARSITTEILISLVEIISMFTPSLRQRLEHLAGHAGVALHADADDGQLADLVGGDDLAEADLRLQAVDDLSAP